MIIRVQKDKENPYVMVNKQFVNDKNLSWKAKGILLYLLSLPDNWEVNAKELQVHSSDGKDSLSKGIQELISCGYIEREKTKNKSGRFDGWSYTVCEVSTENRLSDFGKTDYGKSATNNNEILNNKDNKKNNVYATRKLVEQNLSSFNQEIVSCIFDFIDSRYESFFGCKHPRITIQQFQVAYNNIESFMSEYSIDTETIEYMLEDYVYDNTIKTNNHSIMLFATEGIMRNRYNRIR
jgi:predicted transcriptional regulator